MAGGQRIRPCISWQCGGVLLPPPMRLERREALPSCGGGPVLRPTRSSCRMKLLLLLFLVFVAAVVGECQSTGSASDATTSSSSSAPQRARRRLQRHVVSSLSTAALSSSSSSIDDDQQHHGHYSIAGIRVHDDHDGDRDVGVRLGRRRRRRRRRRHLVTPSSGYTNSTLLRDTAVSWYRTFCPDFVWSPKKLRKGRGGTGCRATSSLSTASSQVRFTTCGYTHVLRRYDMIVGPTQVTFRYDASRNGISSRRMLSIVCPYDRRMCRVMNVWCGRGAAGPTKKPTRPTRRPVAPTKRPTKRPTRRPTRVPTQAPVLPTTRTCTSCLTQQGWTCAYAETCGCNVNNCLPPNAPTPNCSCQTMVPVPWNSQNQATIEMCQDFSNSSVYGYRLPGQHGCHLAALMVRVVPGNQYRLTIRNRALDNSTTNLHTHGLHISGDGNSDNPMRIVSAGNCITYHWDIPSDHMGGTHWMHSHDMQHGYTQVRGGALAMFIVEENPSLLDNVDAASQPGIAAWLKNELLLVATRTLLGHRGNGLSNAQLNMTVGEWYRLRILGAEIDGNEFFLRLPFPCTIYTVAHDGVWRFVVPNVAGPPTDSEYRMTSAGRLDVAIKCPRPGSFPITAVSSVVPNSVIATLNVRSGTPSIATPFTSTGATWSTSRPSYLQNLLDPSVTVDNNYGIIISYSSVNGRKYQMDDPPLDNFTHGSVQEWTVSNAGKPHSYHQHVHHFQVVSCDGFDAGEFYDTILPVANSDPCVLRFRMSDYSGNLFLHCHTIAHSEMGSMARFVVSDGGITNGNEDYDEFVC